MTIAAHYWEKARAEDASDFRTFPANPESILRPAPKVWLNAHRDQTDCMNDDDVQEPFVFR